MRVVLFLAILVTAGLTGCVRDSGETATILEPQPIDGSPKMASPVVTPDTRGLSGVYEGDAAVITVSRVNEAWEVNCTASGNNSHTYLSLTPFNGERRIYGMNYTCTTGKKKTKDIYQVTFKKKKKNLQCTYYDTPIIAEYDEQWKYLDLLGSQLRFNNTPPYLEMCMAMIRTEDCGKFEGDYPKK